jgi:hypothetical protein
MASALNFAPYASKSVPRRLKPSSAQRIYGTAEPVPFVRQSRSPASPVLSELTNRKSDLDRCEVQTSPFDKLRAGSTGLDWIMVVLTQALSPRHSILLRHAEAVLFVQSIFPQPV